MAGRDGAARVLGPRRRAAAEHAASARARCRRMSAARPRHRRRTERARRRDPAGRGRALGHSCSRRPTRPAAPYAPRSSRCPGFHHDTFSSVYPGGRRLAGVRAHAARAPRPARGSTPRRATRTRCRAGDARRPLPRPRAHRRDLDARAPGRRRALARVRRAVRSSTSTRVRATMLAGFPPLRAGRWSCSARAGAVGALEFARCCPGSAQRLGAPAVQRRRLAGVAVRLGDARRRPADGRRAARSPPPT